MQFRVQQTYLEQAIYRYWGEKNGSAMFPLIRSSNSRETGSQTAEEVSTQRKCGERTRHPATLSRACWEVWEGSWGGRWSLCSVLKDSVLGAGQREQCEQRAENMIELEDSWHVWYLCFPSVMETGHEMWLQKLWGSNQGDPVNSVSSVAQSCPHGCHFQSEKKPLEEEGHGQILRGWL